MIYFIVALTVYLLLLIQANVIHRGVHHYGIERTKAFCWYMRHIARWTLGMDITTIAIVHWEHHRYPDTELDPHSPNVPYKGRETTIFNRFTNQIQKNVVQRYKRGELDHIVRELPTGGICAPLMITESPVGQMALTGIMYTLPVYLLTGDIFLGLAAMGGMLASHFMLYLYSVTTHTIGYANFVTKDLSTNHWFNLVMFPFETAYHNNHHAFPHSPKTNVLPGEYLDFGWYALVVLDKLGIITIRREAIPTQKEVEEFAKVSKKSDDKEVVNTATVGFCVGCKGCKRPCGAGRK